MDSFEWECGRKKLKLLIKEEHIGTIDYRRKRLFTLVRKCLKLLRNFSLVDDLCGEQIYTFSSCFSFISVPLHNLPQI